MKLKNLVFILLFSLYSTIVCADNDVVNLIVSYKTVNFAGKNIQALAFNNQIPGPTLHFKEGDHVTINVYNHLNMGTAVHWHGVIVPWAMDGVAYLTQAPIPPGGVYHYQFTLHQSGTYWYHAHAGMQQQQGLYGAIIIDPKHPRYQVNHDDVIMLSDWSNTDPDQIMANLKKDGDYYQQQMPLQPSLYHFIKSYQEDSPNDRQQLIDAYKMMQWMRMSPYDISDVAYDAFLLNGQPPATPWQSLVKVGDTVCLRFINAASSSTFRLKIPGTTITIIQVDGKDVAPYQVNDLEIAPGETFNGLIKITHTAPDIIYVESVDASGATIGALVTQPNQAININDVQPFPEPKPISMMSTMSGMDSMGPMDMANMSEATMNNNGKYQDIKSLVKTNNPNLPVQEIRIVLNGYMGRFVWFINGVPEYKAKPIMIEPGIRYRLIFVNNTMMHHPMHVHGHWFILRNGHGAYDPLLHTIDVPPNSTVIADMDAEENNGIWYFHCHNLYHMMSGMATEFEYPNTPTNAPSNAQTYTPTIPVQEDSIVSSNFFDIGGGLVNFYQATFNGLIGTDDNKLNLYSNEASIKDGSVENTDLDIFYWHAISEFWAIKGGANYVYRPATTPYLQPGIGIEGLAPYFINTNIRSYFSDGSAKLDVDLFRDTQLTNNFYLRLGLRSIMATKTLDDEDVGSGINDIEYTVRPYYRLTPWLALYIQYQHTDYYGDLSTIRQNNSESTAENTLTIGLSTLF